MSKQINCLMNDIMNENISDFDINFMPKTDDTFIAPNDQFNSFSQRFSNNFGLKTSNTENTKPEDNAKSGNTSARETTKRKIGSSVQTNDKFIDFIVKQYKSDGFVCTVDENERQIYYCYYCHQYVNDYDLIQAHIDTSGHLNNVLNGISLKKGLDKEFVVDSTSEKPPKNRKDLIFKELSRLPLHIKHYYFRNGIRIMDIMPPNGYFCTFCKQSIHSLKEIENHLSTETHKTSQQKPTLMQLIDTSDDITLNIGLKFITEDKISDLSQVVYECELCNCFDCNTEKMFAHLKSSEHRISLLKKFNYETKDLTEEEIENNIKEIHEKHGSTDIKPSDSIKRTKVSAEPSTEPKSSPQPTTPLDEALDSNSGDSLDGFYGLLKEKSETDNYFLQKDIVLDAFESHKIIQSYESDGREIYYCCYCDQYSHSLALLMKHIDEVSHKKSNFKNCAKGLNDKLLMKRFTDPTVPSNESLSIQALNEISNVDKHFYYKRGIKYTGADYYCRLCQKSIPSLDKIEEHFESESHLKIEEKPTKFNDLLFQTCHPIIGLKYITENMSTNSKQVSYDCTLCDYSNDFCQMFVHINCFTHQFKALRKIAPNSRVFKYVKENQVSLKASEMLKKEISRIEHRIGCGFVTKVLKSPDRQQIPPECGSTVNVTKTLCKREKRKTSSESRKSIDDQKSEPTDTQCSPLSEEMLLSYLQTLFTVRLKDENEASILVSIVESLKDSLIKYYIPTQTTPSAEPKCNESTGSHNVCKTDEI